MVLREELFVNTTIMQWLQSDLDRKVDLAQQNRMTDIQRWISPHILTSFNHKWWKGDRLVVVEDTDLRRG